MTAPHSSPGWRMWSPTRYNAVTKVTRSHACIVIASSTILLKSVPNCSRHMSTLEPYLLHTLSRRWGGVGTLRLIIWCLSTSTIHTVWLARPSHGDGMVYLARLDVWWYMSTRHHTFLGHYSRSLCPAHGNTAWLSPRGDNHRPGTDCVVTGTPPVAHGNTHIVCHTTDPRTT